MNSLNTVLIFGSILSGFMADAATPAKNSGNPFEYIVAKNIFKLQPPFVVETNPPPLLPKVALTGIITVGRRQALIEFSNPGKPKTFSRLAEGESVGTIEMLRIDEAAETATIRNNGVVTTITFEQKPATPLAPSQRRELSLLPPPEPPR